MHDKMLAAIDAYFSASDGTEAEVAENLLLDVRDEINKQKYVPETNFGNMAEPKIGCVNHDCDKCKAVQEPWVGLTDEEVSKIIDAVIGFNSCWGPEEDFARAIEAKLKEKNA
jgi:hypothetical protein